MLTVEKLRVKYYWAIIFFQVIFSHVALIPLAVSCIFDSPYQPLFGVPYFIFSSLRPYRNAPQINKLYATTKESHIYNTIFSQIITNNHLISAQPLWSHQLLKLGKFFWIIQLLEYCGGYAVIQFKGLASQDTCSSSEEINQIERLIQNKDINCITYSALQLNNSSKVGSYEETKMTLAGIIQTNEFVSGFKQIYLRMLCYFSQELQDDNLKSIIRLSKEQDQYGEHFPVEFARMIKLNSKFEEKQTEIEEKQIQVTIQKIKIKQEDDDCADMLNNQSIDDPPLKIQLMSQDKSTGIYVSVQKAILYLYQISEFDVNGEKQLNQKQLFELFQSPKYLLNKHTSLGIEQIFYEIVSKAVRAALKFSLDLFMSEGNLQINDEKLIEQLQLWSLYHVGTSTEIGWQSVMQNKIELWSQQIILQRSTMSIIQI